MGTGSAGALGRMLVAGSVDLFDLLPAPVLLVELDSARIIFANAAAQSMAGGRYPPGSPSASPAVSGSPPSRSTGSAARSWPTAARSSCPMESASACSRSRTSPRSRPRAAAPPPGGGERRARRVARPGADPAHDRRPRGPAVRRPVLRRADRRPRRAGAHRRDAGRAAARRGSVIGGLTLAMDRSGRRYTEADLQAAQQLANRFALAIDNSRLVGELRAARGAAGDPRGRGRRGHRAGARRLARLRQRGRGAAARRSAARRSCSPRRSPSSWTGTRCSTRRARRSRSTRMPGRRALRGRAARAGDRALPHARRRRVRALGADQGPAGARRRRRAVRLAINVGRGHHRAQAGRGGPALPGRGEPRAGRLARLRADARVRRPARRPRHRRLVRDRPAGDDGEVQHVAVAHADPRRSRWRASVAARTPPTRRPPGVHRVIRTGRAPSCTRRSATS